MPDGKPTELLVRLYPDTIHADGHATTLSAAEQDLGRAFWERTWRAGGDAAGESAAFAWLAGALGPWRAAFVAGVMTPTNADRAPAAPVPDDQPLAPAPRFPAQREQGVAEPTRARLLPERFAVVAYANEAFWGPYWGAGIPAGLAMAPGPAELDATGDAGARALLQAQGLAWTYDFEEAERVGMGVRIDLSTVGGDARERGFTELVAFGVSQDDGREALEDLLRAHRYTHGLDLIPQGTPTNRTETAPPGLCLETPDLDALRASELEAAAVERPVVADEGDLFRMDGGDAVSVALGLTRDNAVDRASNAGLRELPWAEAMSRLLWPAIGGFAVDSLFGAIVAGEGRAWLRDWSTRFVRGAAPLPTLLVGAQPYGVLPATLVTPPTGTPVGDIDQVEYVLRELALLWGGSRVDIPRLDPDWTDVSDDAGAEAGLVSQVLGALPHLTSLGVRRVDPLRSDYWHEYSDRLSDLALACMTEYDEEWPKSDYEDLQTWSRWQELDAALAAATTVDEQILAFEAMADGLEAISATGAPRAYYDGWAEWTRTALVGFARAHSGRVLTVQWLVDRNLGATGLLGDLGDPLSFTTACPEPESAPWTLPLVADDHTDVAIAGLQEWLADLAATLAASGTSPDQPTDALPLLRQLAARSAALATDPGDLTLLRDGVGRNATSGLRAVVGEARDPVAELERLLREALGPWSYRMDAWYTGIGAWRLENKRAARPRGVQTGAFGWVVDVHPRTGPASQGYVLTPSLTHAATAAILRSGWAAFGGSGESAGLATNLSSERMRRAMTIVDGVREGQDLRRLLGARLERRLGDAGLGRYVEDVRQAALTAVEDPAPPNAIVDGLLVARARSGATDLDEAEDALRQALVDLVKGAGAAATAFGAALDEAGHDLDAAADAAVAQSVYALAQGNVPEATASLTAASTGEVAFPHLRVADTPRGAQTVTHRLVLCVDPGADGGWPGAARSGRARAAPALEAWLAGLLGDDDYDVAVRFADPATGATLAGPFAASLSAVGLAALDAVYLAPAGDEVGLGRLGALVAAWADERRPNGLDPAAVTVVDGAAGDRPLDDLATVARALRRLLANGRDLDGRDLVGPGGAEASSGLDSGELGDRVGDVREALVAGRARLDTALGTARDVREALGGLAGFDLGDTPAGLADDALAEHARGVLQRIDARLTELDARIAADDAAWATWDEVARTAALRGRIELLVGHALPVAPRFRAANGAELDATFDRSRVTSREQATGWLSAVGRVEPGARRLRVAIDLAEALRDDVLFDVAVGQLPDHPEEGWVAVTAPTADDRGRLSIVVTGTRPSFAAGDAAGVVLGSLDESVPVGRQTAALAVHFDAPSARAPQAVLVCTTTEGGWSFDIVRDTVKQTLDLARLRMLDLSLMVPGEVRPIPSSERPPGIGQYLPINSLPLDVEMGGTA